MRPISCRSIRLLRLALLALGCAASPALRGVAAEPGTIAGPSLGFVFDPPSHSIRPVIGLAGAAYLGVPAVAEVDLAVPAPNGRYALAVRAGNLDFVRNLTGQPDVRPVEGVSGAPGYIAWSADSRTALLWLSASGRLQWLQATSEGVTMGAAADLTQLGPVTMVALSPDGARALVGIRDAGLYRLAPDAPPELAVAASEPVAVAFDPDGRDVYVADRARKQVIECADAFGVAASDVILAETDGLRDPVGIALAGGSGNLLIADRERKSLLIYQTAARIIAGQVDLDEEPSRLERLAATSFLLTSRRQPEDPLWLLETRSAPTAWFVPAGK